MQTYDGPVRSPAVRALSFKGPSLAYTPVQFPRFQRPDWRSQIILHKSAQGCTYYTSGEVQVSTLEVRSLALI